MVCGTSADWVSMHYNSEGEAIGNLRVTKLENGNISMQGPNIWGDVTFSVEEIRSLLTWYGMECQNCGNKP